MNTESGLENLRRATKLGHVEASYVLGMILICNGEDLEKQEGMKVLNTMMSLKLTTDCRKKFKAIRDVMWLMEKLDRYQKPKICTRHPPMKKGQGWHSIDSEDADELPCQACRYDREVLIFRNILCC